MKITISHEGDRAAVDIDTLWTHRRTGHPNHWKGGGCQLYTKLNKGWKRIMHTGVLDSSILESLEQV